MKNTLLFLFLTCFVLISCKDSVEPEEENELITTVKLSFTTGGKTLVYSYKDLDGDGGKMPVIDKIVLSPNTEYFLSTEFLDESKTPTVSITEEILAEAAEHLVFYTPSSANLGTFTYSDKDKNGFNIGLKGIFKTNAVQNGSLKVQLRHQPDVNGKRVKDGSITPGSDDLNVSFTLEIK